MFSLAMIDLASAFWRLPWQLNGNGQPWPLSSLQMAESRLRQIWTGLMPSFPEPDALLHISDPDDRAVTMLLKTLYVVFKG